MHASFVIDYHIIIDLIYHSFKKYQPSLRLKLGSIDNFVS